MENALTTKDLLERIAARDDNTLYCPKCESQLGEAFEGNWYCPNDLCSLNTSWDSTGNPIPCVDDSEVVEED